ncbi:hypothetical protein L598_000700000700 [Mesorhizobium sp. J18]|uniref:hypothetical protein n=1 Tax=Mesorhizobium sp. J18 TaxID=935263 RepID=UPI00119B9169|nr:hypothetical protein [Mesorhizobium sp. J18]TWG90314.1 hypothetical protein L598_000700000700 [Mesorhizobium sp. J18]
MTSMVDFPVKAVPITDVSLAIGYNTRPGHEATNGMRRSIGVSGAQFRLRFTVHVHSNHAVRAVRGFVWNMEADSALVRIRIPDLYGIDGPFALATKAHRDQYPQGIPFATDALYATGIGHAYPTLETTVTEPADLNAREIKVALLDETIGGCAISIDEFCYGIAGSWVEGDTNRLRLSPTLRKPIASGATVSLAPIFVGFCITDNPGYEALHAGMYGDHTLEFVEDLTRLVESVD